MLPYLYTNPKPHHFISQDASHGGVVVGAHQEPPPNPGYGLLPPPSLDPYELLGHGQFHCETLEAVLRPPAPAAPEAAVPVDHASSPPMPRNGASRIARKRPFRTDRHSKIRTAQGVRDRRMRLSLDVAREFFALQDRLGFDKASQTVDWLLTQSKPAIERLSGSLQPNGSSDVSMSSTSECFDQLLAMSGSKEMAVASRKEKGEQSLMDSAKDAREKARARARERTVEKMRRKAGHGSPMEHASELERLVSASFDQPLEGDGAMDGLYYYLSEMLNNIGGGDDNANEEEGDFLDGMQYY